MLVRSRMTAHVYTASPATTIAEALALTRRHRIRHLPVVDTGKLVGLVTDRDLRLAMPPIWAEQHDQLREMLHTKTVGEVMVGQIITTTPDTPIEDAARRLYEHRIGCLPVMEEDRLVGILTETDVLRSFTELFGANDPSSRLEIRLPNRPGELARVVRLIGVDFKLNITGMVVPPLTGGDVLAIMHIATLNPQPVIESLRKLGYQVGWPALDLEPQSSEPRHEVRERRRFFADVF